MITGAQLHAARTVLRLPLRRLAEKTGLPTQALLDAERAAQSALNPTIERLVRDALKGTGILFTDEGGLPTVEITRAGAYDDDRR